MSWWTDFFTSRHTRWLEAEIADLKQRHAAQIEELKIAHARELGRAITEAIRAMGEADRLRLYLTPELRTIGQSEPETISGARKEHVFTGTPWQRVLAREIAKQDADWTVRHVKPAEEKPDGVSSEGRDEAPLSEQSSAA